MENSVEDTNLIASVNFLKQRGILREWKNDLKFESVREAEENAKQEVVDSITDKMNSLKQEISEVRKAGFELDLEGIKLLEVPLKIRVWKAGCREKDLEVIMKILDSVDKALKEIRPLYDNFIAEKEKRENA